MSVRQKTGKSPYILLALGMAAGGLGVAFLPHLVTSAQAQQGYPLKPIAGISGENMAALRALDNSFASLAEYIEPSVVQVTSSTGTQGTDVLGRRMGEEQGVGTGVIYRKDGWIITNDHVVAGFDKIKVTFADGRVLPAKTVHEASDSDLAVIKVDANDLPAANFGDSAKVRAGQFAMAIGSPFALDQTVTVGHISALGRSNQMVPDPRSPMGYRSYSDLIQTDTPINMGNSGGPLINVDGQVIGINSAILSQSGGSNGIGFAIPSDEASTIADELISKGSITRAFLGLAPSNIPPYQQKELGIDGGARVMPFDKSMPAPSPAENAGIKADDIIVRVGTFSIRNQQDVRDSMLHYAPGTTVPIEVLRGKEHKTFDVKLGDASTYEQKLEQNYKNSQQSAQGDNGNPFSEFPDLRNFPNGGFGQGPRTRRNQGDQTPHTGHAKLGVTVESIDDNTRNEFNIPSNVQGAVVTSVAPGSAADDLGIQPGFVIQRLGNKQIRSGQDLQDAMRNVNYGDSLQITFGKYGANSQETQTVTVNFK